MSDPRFPNRWKYGVAMALLLGSAAIFAATPLRGAATQTPTAGIDFVPGELLVKFRYAPETVSAASEFLAEVGARAHKRLGRSGIHRIELPAGSDPRALAQLYAADPRIEYAEPNYIYRATATPNDTDYGNLWGLKNIGQFIASPVYATNNPGIAGYDMNAEEAWDLQRDCRGVVVAVIDTGINYTHQDLAANMWDGSGAGYPNHGWDFVDGDNDPFPSGGNHHGTHVAGTIGAVGNNGSGITGVCWQARLMSLRVLDAGGAGTTVEIVQALDFAIQQGARVVNMSLGGSGASLALSDKIAEARAAGIVVVVAAGNSGSDNDASPSYPCAYPHDNIICVAALDQAYDLANFSNYGAASVDVGAPGTNIKSSVAGPSTGDDFTSGWSLGGGWAQSNPGTYCLSSSLVNPGDFCTNPSATYANNADEVAYKTFDLSASARGIGFSLVHEYYVGGGDSYSIAIKPSGGDPFVGTTPLLTTSGVSLSSFGYDLSTNCQTATCSIGFRLQSDASGSASDYGVRIFNFQINTAVDNASSYTLFNGTSMATPHVAGLAALVWSYNPGYSYRDVIRSVVNSGDIVSSLSGFTTSGRAVDAYQALIHLQPPSGVTAVVR
ncbi:MAG: S8 family serine peptidase [Gammaproteobacteria bacterium]